MPREGGREESRLVTQMKYTRMRLIVPLSMVIFRELNPFVRHRRGVSELILHFFGFGAAIFAKNSGSCVVVVHSCTGRFFREVIEASLELWFSNSLTAPGTSHTSHQLNSMLVRGNNTCYPRMCCSCERFLAAELIARIGME